jgi:hypothetical protein
MQIRPRIPAGRGWGLLALGVLACPWLGSPASPQAPSSDLAAALIADRELDVRWVAREPRAVRGYRLTATMDGGSASRLISGRTVDEMSGVPMDVRGDLRVYQVQLPVPGERRGRVRITLKALCPDGSSFPLTAQEVPLGAVGHEARQALSAGGQDRVKAGAEACTPRGVAPRLAAIDPVLPASMAWRVHGAASLRGVARTASNTLDAANGRSPPA